LRHSSEAIMEATRSRSSGAAAAEDAAPKSLGTLKHDAAASALFLCEDSLRSCKKGGVAHEQVRLADLSAARAKAAEEKAAAEAAAKEAARQRELEAATAEAATAEAATAAGATAAGRAAVAVQDAAAAAERASAGRVAAAERAAAAVLAAPPTRRAHCVGGGCRRPHPSRHLPAARLVYAPPPPASLSRSHASQWLSRQVCLAALSVCGCECV
jgi:hypothetical protein